MVMGWHEIQFDNPPCPLQRNKLLLHNETRWSCDTEMLPWDVNRNYLLPPWEEWGEGDPLVWRCSNELQSEDGHRRAHPALSQQYFHSTVFPQPVGSRGRLTCVGPGATNTSVHNSFPGRWKWQDFRRTNGVEFWIMQWEVTLPESCASCRTCLGKAVDILVTHNGKATKIWKQREIVFCDAVKPR